MPTMATKNIPPASTPSGENRRGMASLSITNAIKITKKDIMTAPRIENL